MHFFTDHKTAEPLERTSVDPGADGLMQFRVDRTFIYLTAQEARQWADALTAAADAAHAPACECLCHDVLDQPCGGCDPCEDEELPRGTRVYPEPPTDPALDTECEGCS